MTLRTPTPLADSGCLSAANAPSAARTVDAAPAPAAVAAVGAAGGGGGGGTGVVGSSSWSKGFCADVGDAIDGELVRLASGDCVAMAFAVRSTEGRSKFCVDAQPC